MIIPTLGKISQCKDSNNSVDEQKRICDNKQPLEKEVLSTTTDDNQSTVTVAITAKEANKREDL